MTLGRGREVEAATERISRGRAGLWLSGHRLESAFALTKRFEAGLPLSLRRLAADARITVLDRAVSIEAGRDAYTIRGRVASSQSARARVAIPRLWAITPNGQSHYIPNSTHPFAQEDGALERGQSKAAGLPAALRRAVSRTCSPSGSRSDRAQGAA